MASDRAQDLEPVVSTHLSTLAADSGVPGSGSETVRRVFSRYVCDNLDNSPERERGSGCTAPRSPCADFNPSTGVYRVSVDGHFLIRASLLLPAAAAARICSRVAMIISPARGDYERAEQLPSGGDLALLLHLRCGDCVSVQLLPSPAIESDPLATASESPLRELAEPTNVRLSVELAMRKRKREASSDEDEAAEGSAARAPRAARGAAGSGTGSDTEWSEGFSSDDSAHAAALPPAAVRRVTRRLNRSLGGPRP